MRGLHFAAILFFCVTPLLAAAVAMDELALPFIVFVGCVVLISIAMAALEAFALFLLGVDE